MTGVDPNLVAVVARAFDIWATENQIIRLMVVEGLRTRERQAELYAQGRTKPGKVVTWTLNSKHIDGKAVDLAPVADGVIQWGSQRLFDRMIDCMLRAASELGTEIRSGADWDRDGIRREARETDSPHFELYP